MAVLQMKKIRICAVRQHRKRFLEFLQRQGCVEVHDADVCDVFSRADVESARGILKKGAKDAMLASKILDAHCPRKSSMADSLQGRKAVGVAQGDAFYDKGAAVLKAARRIIQLEKTAEELKAAILKIEGEVEPLTPWLTLPTPQTLSETKRTRIFIGSLDGEHTAEDLAGRLSRAGLGEEAVHIELVHASQERTYFYLLTLARASKAAEEALRLIGFVYPASPVNKIPRELKQSLLRQKEEARAKLQECEDEIKAYAPLRDDLLFLEDHMTMRDEKYGVLQKLAQSKHVFVLSGYIAARDFIRLEQNLLSRFDCIIEAEDAGEDADAPVKLQNSSFASPAEMILESYSMPGKAELDPTSVMSIFYYLMFGLMFSDAGYGLILSAVCGGLLLRFKRMEPATARFLTLFFWCGVSTVFWGIVFSSYFGDALNVVTRVFCGREVGIPPLWFAPLENPMKLLIFCLGIGIIHLITGYIMKARNQAAQGQYMDIVYDVVFPVVILLCFIIILMGSQMFGDMAGFRLSLAPQVSGICLSVAAICMLGVILTGGRESKSWVKRLLKGIYALYNVLAGWLGDILSYSRLLALGLATGVIASVINSLGAMAGSGVVGVIIFILVFAVGHLMNFGINVLGAYVHSNRLEYVEFFGKFYEGGGRKFAPYGIHTKYYTIEEASKDV